MAEGDGVLYRTFLEDVMSGHHDLDTGGNTLKMMLVAGYTPDTEAHNVWADVSTKAVTGTGATAQTLANQTVIETGTAATGTGGERGKFDADDVTFSTLNIGGTSGAPSHAVLYNDTPTSPADPLIGYWEVTTASNGGNYKLQFGAGGIVILHK